MSPFIFAWASRVNPDGYDPNKGGDQTIGEKTSSLPIPHKSGSVERRLIHKVIRAHTT
jgi:hypothetical protein